MSHQSDKVKPAGVFYETFIVGDEVDIRTITLIERYVDEDDGTASSIANLDAAIARLKDLKRKRETTDEDDYASC